MRNSSLQHFGIESAQTYCMTLLGMILLIAVVGLVLWIITRYVPMEAAVKQFLVVAVIIVLALYLLSVTGLLSVLNVPVGRVR